MFAAVGRIRIPYADVCVLALQDGVTPVHLAARLGDPEVLKYLVAERKAEVIASEVCPSPLKTAAMTALRGAGWDDGTKGGRMVLSKLFPSRRS